jgi:uncharacterized membrane protein
MNIRTPLIVSLLLIALMTAASVWGWIVLPAHTILPVHWGVDGAPNGFLPKETALLLLPGIAIGMTALFALLPRIEPRRKNLLASRKPYIVGWIGGLVVIAAAQILSLVAAAGFHINVASAILIVVALMIAVLGNYLGKAHSNFFFGVRTPWTLSSDLAWEKSNRLLGRLLVASGLIVLATRLAFDVRIGFLVFTALIGASAVIAVVASYIFWRSDPDRRAGRETAP